jgi:hypothetical protein
MFLLSLEKEESARGVNGSRFSAQAARQELAIRKKARLSGPLLSA